ncbi:MAG: hypothetical protein VYA34_10525 [Myxococcota bacterium]|nr:hypothetical protein [Myxococcota bacterium]
MSRLPLQREPCERVDAAYIRALGIVFSVAFNHQELKVMMSQALQEVGCLNMWPSSIYRLTAGQVYRTRQLWARILPVLDRRLSPWKERYEGLPPSELCRVFMESGYVMSPLERASILMIFVVNREPSVAKLCDRLCGEMEFSALVYMGENERNSEHSDAHEAFLN